MSFRELLKGALAGGDIFALDKAMRDYNRLQFEYDEQGNKRQDWESECDNCGETPIVPETGMCGPCTWGEAETAAGNW